MHHWKAIPALLFFLLISIISQTSVALTKNEIETSNVIQTFIQHMVAKTDFAEKDILYYLRKAEVNADILQKIAKPYEGKPWDQYQKFFIASERIHQGVALWEDYPPLFEDIEARYGIPSSIIIAIMGVETFYGQILGNHRVLDALTTLAFYYPPRAPFFTEELKQYFLLCRELDIDPTTLYGSYAGAIGQAQFMPSSYRRYAVDYNDKGTKDLVGNSPDAIASIANYLKEKGWHANEPIAIPVTFKDTETEKALTALPQPTLRPLSQWHAEGLAWQRHFTQDFPARLLTLSLSNHEKEYWLVFHNFDVLLTYNKSPQYAMAVYLLNHKIKSLYREHQKNSTLIEG